MAKNEKSKVTEREIIIKGIRFCVRSVFAEQTTLEKAMGNIIVRKISDSKAKWSA